MAGRIRKHLSYANVMATIAVFLVLSGGTAVALSGSNTVFSDDIVHDQVYATDVRNDSLAGGGLGASDLRTGSVGAAEATGLTGADIANAPSGSDNVNADTLDGAESSSFVRGGGETLADTYTNSSPTNDWMFVRNDFMMAYYCRSAHTSTNGEVLFDNNRGVGATLYVDNGGASPSVANVTASDGGGNADEQKEQTHFGGEMLTYQVRWDDGKLATLVLTSHHQTSGCAAQVHGVISG